MDSGKGERGAAHIHIVVNGINNISHIIRDLWEKGWISIKPLDKSGQYRKLAGYFIKYSDKTMKTEQGFINKRYCSSRNLHIPEPEKRVIRGRNAYSHKIEVRRMVRGQRKHQRSLARSNGVYVFFLHACKAAGS